MRLMLAGVSAACVLGPLLTGRVPKGALGEALQVVIPLGQQVEHVRPDQWDANATLPPTDITSHALLGVVVHNSYKDSRHKRR